MKQINRVYQTFRSFRREQALLCILIILSVLLTAYLPLVLKNLINAITVRNQWDKVLQSGLLMLAVTVVEMVINLFKNYRWHKLRYQAINFLRLKMFASIINKPLAFFQKNGLGEITAKTLDDVINVAQQGVIGPTMLFANLFRLITAVTILSILQIRLAIVVMVFIPIYYLLFNLINPRLQNSSKMERVKYSKVMKDTQEKYLGIRTIKIFKKEDYIIGNFRTVLDNHFIYVCKNLFYMIIGNGITSLMVSILPIIILLYGGYLVFQHSITLGALIAFYTYLNNLYEPIKNLSDYHLMLQNTLGMCERVLSFFDNEDEEQDGYLQINGFQSLEFKDVDFQYEQDKLVLRKLNFKIEQGDRVLIIGQSGSGKSSLLNLIMKIYTPVRGSIKLNNHDLRDISKDSLYSHITLLDQSNFLFDGTIMNNITFGDEVGLEKIERVAKLAKLDSIIMSSPERFGRKITELGLNLSGGERQRICLARTLLRETDLVILDEATSALDSALESEIVTNLDEYLGGRTFIAVSHRPALLEICNKVLHFENGVLVGYYQMEHEEDYASVYELISRPA